MKKARILAEFTLPAAVAAEAAKREAHAQQQLQQQQQKEPEQSQDSHLSLSPRKPAPSAPASAAAIHWQENAAPLAPHDCKNLIRFIVNPVKVLAVALSSSHLTAGGLVSGCLRALQTRPASPRSASCSSSSSCTDCTA